MDVHIWPQKYVTFLQIAINAEQSLRRSELFGTFMLVFCWKKINGVSSNLSNSSNKKPRTFFNLDLTPALLAVYLFFL